MTRILSIVAFVLGAIIVLWMAAVFVGSNVLALAVSLLIAAAYTVGFAELLRYQRTSAALATALDGVGEAIDNLDAWLADVPAVLRNVVRQRIQGEYVGLPAPVLAPYLIGLLVMLGLLGTFIGMVDTLKGAVMALEGTTELEAIRAGLAAPIKGLSMAFATSVAGVSASAMLGFISTLSRRERLQVSRQLDNSMTTVFKHFSLSYQRQQSYAAMQSQAQAMPVVAETLSVLADRLSQMGDDLAGKLTSGQNQFHSEAQTQYQQLAQSVDASLKQSLADSGRAAAESMGPVVQTFVQDISAELRDSQQALTASAQVHLAGLNANFTDSAAKFSDGWQQGIAEQQRGSDKLLQALSQQVAQLNENIAASNESLLARFEGLGTSWQQTQQASEQQRLDSWSAAFDQSAGLLHSSAEKLTASARNGSNELLEEFRVLLAASEQLVAARQTSEVQWLAEYQQRMAEQGATLKEALANLHSLEEQRGIAAVDRLGDLQAAVKDHLASLASALEEPMGRLIESASETPRIAAELMAQLRTEMTDNLERDNSLLDDRRELMLQLTKLSASLQESSVAQRAAVESILNNSSELLADISTRFNSKLSDETAKLGDVVSHFEAGSGELASLGDAFAGAVAEFGESNRGIIDSLGTMAASLQQSGERSDEQMAYYVAQAREIIDHNMLTQQDIITQLQQLSVPVAEDAVA